MAERGLDAEGDRWGMEEEIDYGEEPPEEPEVPKIEQPISDDKARSAAKPAGGRGVLAGGKIDLSGKGDGRSRHGEKEKGRGRYREEGNRYGDGREGDRDRGSERGRRDDGRRERKDAENAVRDGGRRDGERWEADRREDERADVGERDREKKHRHRHKSRKDEYSHADDFDSRPSTDPRPEDDASHRSSKDSRRSRRARDDAPVKDDVLGDLPVVSPGGRLPTPEHRKKEAGGDEGRDRKSRKGADVNGRRGERWDRKEDEFEGGDPMKEDGRRHFDREERAESERRFRDERGPDDRRPYDRDHDRREGRGFDDRRAFDRDDDRRGRFEQRVGFDGGRERGPRPSPPRKRSRTPPARGGRDDFRRDEPWRDDKRWDDGERRYRGGDDARGGRERRFERNDDDWEMHPPERRWGGKEDERGGGGRREEVRGEGRDFREGRERFDPRGEDFRGRGPLRQAEEPPRRAAGDRHPSPLAGKTPPRRDASEREFERKREAPEASKERDFDRKRSPRLQTRSRTPPPKRRELESPVGGDRARDDRLRDERAHDFDFDPSPRSRKAHRDADYDNGGPVDEAPPSPQRGRTRSVRGESVQRESKTADDFEYERSERRRTARSRNESEERESRAPPRSPIDDRRLPPRFEGRSPIRPQGGPPPHFPEGGLPPHEKGRGRGGFGMEMGPRWRGSEFPRGRGGYVPPPFSPAFAPPQFGGPPRPFPARVPGPEFGPGPLPFGPRGQFPEGGFGRGWRGPPHHEMDGPAAMVPPMGAEWDRRGGPWERYEPWGEEQPRRDFAPPFEMGGDRREPDSEGRAVRKAPVSGSGGERKGEDKPRAAPPKMLKREPRKGNTAMAAVKAMAGGLQVSQQLAGAELFEEYKKLLPLSVAMRKGAGVTEKIASSPEEDSEAVGAEERLHALGLADKLPPGTFEASLKLLTDSDSQSCVQQSAVGYFLLPAAVQGLKLGPKPVFLTSEEAVGTEVSPDRDLETGNMSQVEAKPGPKVDCIVEGFEGEEVDDLPGFAVGKGRTGPEKFGNGKAGGDVRTTDLEIEGNDDENVDYGNLDVGMEDEVDYGMDEDEGYGALGGLRHIGNNGFAGDGEESDPELDMVLGRRMAELIGAESRAKAAANASGRPSSVSGKGGAAQQVLSVSDPLAQNESEEGDAEKGGIAEKMGSESGILDEQLAGGTLTQHTL